MKKRWSFFPIILFGFMLLVISADAQDFTPGFHLKLSGGMGTFNGSDFNTAIDGLNRKLSDLSALSGFGTIRSLERFKWGTDLSVEAIMDISPVLAASIGIGHIRRDLDTAGEIEVADVGSASLAVNPTFTATPIELNIYYTVPLVSSLNVNFKAGGSYYLGKCDFSYREDERLAGTLVTWEHSYGTANAAALGIQGGISLEYRLSDRIGLFLEAGGRYANLKNWDFSGRYDDYQGSQALRGTWYYAEGYDENTEDYYPTILIDDETPGGWYLRNVRKAEINYSGLIFKVGIKIRIGQR